MYLLSTFPYSTHLELMLKELHKKGVPEQDIQAYPLDRRAEPASLFDSIHRSDGKSLFDLAAVLGSIFMLFGAMYGYILTWGPIIWSLIGLFSGAVIGFVIDFTREKIKQHHEVQPKGIKDIKTEVILIINCQNHNISMIEKILWDHLALGVCKITH